MKETRNGVREAAFGIFLTVLLGSCAMMQDIDGITIADPDLRLVKDGRWVGAYATTLVSAETAVTVGGHRIRGIEIIKHDCGLGKPAERISAKVMEAQSLRVDGISGATASSKVLLKAMERALVSGMAEAPSEKKL